MADQFKSDLAKALDLKKKVEIEFDRRKKAEAAQQSTAESDSLLRGLINTLAIQVQALEKVVVDGDTSGLLQKTKDERKKAVTELRTTFNFLRGNILEAIDAPGKPKGVLFKKSARGPDGETEDSKDKSNKELHIQSQEMLKKQDEQLEELDGIVKAATYGHQAISSEADVHSNLLDQAAGDMDKTTANMMIVDTKLKQLMKSSSTCCLWIIIILEMVCIGGLLYWVVFG